jgi:hypothetical protein
VVNKRLGRKWQEWDNKSGYSSGTTNKSDASSEMEMVPNTNANTNTNMNMNTSEGLSEALYNRTRCESGDEDDLRIHPFDRIMEHEGSHDDNDDDAEDKPFLALLAPGPSSSSSVVSWRSIIGRRE